jgi:putative transposase
MLCFPDCDSRTRLLQLALEYSRKSHCLIHAYALMDNHLHLLVTGQVDGAVARMMASLLGRHSRLQNLLEGRVGPRWHWRYSSTCVEDKSHLLRCCCYIEANPWRAGIVEHPSQSTWTSYGANAMGRKEELVTPHPAICTLAAPGQDWRGVYREVMEAYISTGVRFKSPSRLPLSPDPLAGLHVFTLSSDKVG